MKLHKDNKTFSDAIQATSDGLNINPVFIEKDYWITLVLKRLYESRYKDNVVFKGGTSLSKGYELIQRFSEDIDIAVRNVEKMTGNQIKTLIRNVEKSITSDLIVAENSTISSKGSQYRKTEYSYPKAADIRLLQGVSDKLIIEINSFTEPYPYEKRKISSFVYTVLNGNKSNETITKYELEPFEINVLDIRQTLVEKTVSLLRFSFENNIEEALKAKIRHFYDLYFLCKDRDCMKYIDSADFKRDIEKVWNTTTTNLKNQMDGRINQLQNHFYSLIHKIYG